MAIGGLHYSHGAILGLGLIEAVIFMAVLFHISSTIKIGRFERIIGIFGGTAALLFLWFISLFIYALVRFFLSDNENTERPTIKGVAEARNESSDCTPG